VQSTKRCTPTPAEIRVALVVPEYRTDESRPGGVSAVADFLYDALVASGMHVHIVSPRMSRKARESRRVTVPSSWRRGAISFTTEKSGIPITYVGSDWAEFEPMRYMPRPVLREALQGFDVIVSVSGAAASCYAFRGLGRPLVAQIATLVALERRAMIRQLSWWMRPFVQLNLSVVTWLERRAIRIPDLLLVENSFMLSEGQKRRTGEVQLRPPGVDTKRYTPASYEGTPSYILSVGRLNDPRKDVESLLYAFHKLRTSYGYRHRLMLVGRYGLDRRNASLIEDLGLKDVVSIHVNMNDSDLVTAYQRADLFVSSSTEEGLGIAMLEALACGTPVVATCTEGAKCILEGENAGRLVPLGGDTGSALAHAMAAVLSDPPSLQAQRVQARRLVEERFSVASQSAWFVSAVKQAVWQL